MVKGILSEALLILGIKVASLEARAKPLDSFGRKAVEPLASDPGKPKYADPIAQITDLAGTRVITFFPSTVEQVDRVIREQFLVVEKSDKAELLEAEVRFGYQSVHYLVQFKPDRTALPEYRRFADLVAEVQVRTILQHAWDEIEHDIQYKSTVTIPSFIRRRFIALAGMLEIADREFQAIQDEDERLRQAARISVEEGKLEGVEITPDALRAYLDQKLGPDGRMTLDSYNWTAETLRKMGFANFHEVEQCISPYDHDRLSRIAYGTRQGQLTRFELQLLAGMGEDYITKHKWGIYPWFSEYWHEKLDLLKKAGISIGNFQPSDAHQEALEP